MRARIVGVVASAAVVLVAASAALGAALGSGGARDAAGPTGTMMSSQRLGQWPDQGPGLKA